MFDVVACPGHTNDHIAFLLNQQHLMIGDTPFSGGGRVFSGTYSEMFTSLNWIKSLNPNTIIYPAHEYTRANLTFAHHVLPDDAPNKKPAHVLKTSASCSLPTTLAHELEINLFLQLERDDLKLAIEHHIGCPVESTYDLFCRLRQ